MSSSTPPIQPPENNNNNNNEWLGKNTIGKSILYNTLVNQSESNMWSHSPTPSVGATSTTTSTSSKTVGVISKPTTMSGGELSSSSSTASSTKSSTTSLNSSRDTPEQVLRKKLREELSDEKINILLRKYPDITDFDDLMCLANTLFDDDLDGVFEAVETLTLSNQTAAAAAAAAEKEDVAERLELREKLLAELDGNVKLVDELMEKYKDETNVDDLLCYANLLE
jgi:hypothetical protein